MNRAISNVFGVAVSKVTLIWRLDMSKNYEVEKCELKTANFTVKFDYEIAKVEYLDGIYIVLLYIPVGIDEVDNIYGVDSNGNVLWRVENPVKAFSLSEDDQGFMYSAKSIYVGLNLDEAGTLSGTTFFAMRYTIDYKTGKLLKEEFMRW